MAGSEQYFMETLYQTHSRLMFATAGKYSSEPADREDIVQNALLRLFKRSKQLQGMDGCALAGYIVFTVRSAAIDFLRSQKKYINHASETEDPADSIPDQKVDIEQRLILAEQAELLRAIWPSLSEDERILLEGKYVWGYDDRELAEILHCKANSVRMKLTRARRKALCQMTKGKEAGENDR